MVKFYGWLLGNLKNNVLMFSNYNYIYYCMTGRAIRGKNILFEIDRIGPTKGRGDTEVENGIFPRIARPEELQ